MNVNPDRSSINPGGCGSPKISPKNKKSTGCQTPQETVNKTVELAKEQLANKVKDSIGWGKR